MSALMHSGLCLVHRGFIGISGRSPQQSKNKEREVSKWEVIAGAADARHFRI